MFYFIIASIFGIFFFSEASLVKDSVTLKRENELIALMNRSADPCVDFYEYACGNFGKLYPIPDYKGKYEVMTRLSEKNFGIVNAVLSRGLKKAQRQAIPRTIDKARIFYASCQDITAINQRGIEPLKKLLDSLGGWPVMNDKWSNPNFDWLQFAIDVSLKVNNNFLFDSYLDNDVYNNTGKRMFHFDIPQTAIRGKNIKLYAERIRETLKKFNLNDFTAETIADEIIEFELGLLSLKKNGSNKKRSVVRTIADLSAENTKMNWARFLSGVYGRNFEPTDVIVVIDTNYFEFLPEFLDEKGSKAVTTYVLWNVVDQLLAVLGDEFLEIINKYNEKAQGYRTSPPRWRACMEIMTDVMNTATASFLIRKIFPSSSTTDIIRMADHLKSTIHDFLLKSNWPGEETRDKSLEKLKTFRIDTSYVNFIYNDTILEEEYKSAVVDYDKFFETYLRLKYLKIEKLARVYGSNSNETLWPFPLINADGFYDRTKNVMALHPGILQSPYYHGNFTKVLDFGGLGMTIAHEIFHSFDDNGAFYDANAQYKRWWSDDDFNEFKNRTKCFDKQYDSYSLHGIQFSTMNFGNSENIADNMGFKFAYIAFDQWLQKNPDLLEYNRIPGLNVTIRQLFFVAVAQAFCVTIRPEAVEYEMSTDPHAPGKYRVIGIVVNSPEFAKQFKCKDDTPMNPSNKCSIW